MPGEAATHPRPGCAPSLPGIGSVTAGDRADNRPGWRTSRNRPSDTPAKTESGRNTALQPPPDDKTFIYRY